jgi:pseudaminic acid cytidylyltransferase
MKIAIIPARGGSKRIPGKNIKVFYDKPMIAWAITIAKESGLFDHIVVSTDDEEIAGIARDWGAETPFKRPFDLADDLTPTVPVISHAVKSCIDLGWGGVDYACCIYPCVPFLRVSDLVAAFDLAQERNADFVYPITEYVHPIQRAMRILPSGQMQFFSSECELMRTQDLENSYHDAGQFYWGKTSAWLQHKRMHSDGLGMEIPNWRVVDIDSMDDWRRAENIYEANFRISSKPKVKNIAKIPPPLICRAYSKSTGFYSDTKSEFFDANDKLLANAERQNNLYTRQPPRSKCKICNSTIPTVCDFKSHHVQYVFCDNCGHLNGMHEDTQSFMENTYIQSDGKDYAKNYLDPNFVRRAELIYQPKFDFLRANLPSSDEFKLLDVGCGSGYFVYAALQSGIDAKGVDVNQTMIEFGNYQISLILHQNPLSYTLESDFFESIASNDATVISAIGVIEHLRDPSAFFDAFHRSNAQYLFYSVPMFSFSSMLENIFPNIFPRQLSGGHTHLFTEQSIEWLHENKRLNSRAEWRFGTDIMDLYRSMRLEMEGKGASHKMISSLNEGFGKNIDNLQAVLDEQHFCSEIHCLVAKG